METCRNKVPFVKVHLRYECILASVFMQCYIILIVIMVFIIIQTKDALEVQSMYHTYCNKFYINIVIEIIFEIK